MLCRTHHQLHNFPVDEVLMSACGASVGQASHTTLALHARTAEGRLCGLTRAKHPVGEVQELLTTKGGPGTGEAPESGLLHPELHLTRLLGLLCVSRQSRASAHNHAMTACGAEAASGARPCALRSCVSCTRSSPLTLSVCQLPKSARPPAPAALVCAYRYASPVQQGLAAINSFAIEAQITPEPRWLCRSFTKMCCLVQQGLRLLHATWESERQKSQSGARLYRSPDWESIRERLLEGLRAVHLVCSAGLVTASEDFAVGVQTLEQACQLAEVCSCKFI